MVPSVKDIIDNSQSVLDNGQRGEIEDKDGASANMESNEDDSTSRVSEADAQ